MAGATSADSACSTDAPLDGAMNEMHKNILSDASAAWAKAGGPVQYLVVRYSSQKEKNEFADGLRAKFPAVPTLNYQDKLPLPNTLVAGGCDPRAPLCLHPVHFAFGPTASMKALPEMNVALRLAEEMLLDGFLSQTEPVQIAVVVVPDGEMAESPLPIQSIGYVKGQARVCTLLGLLSIMMDANVDVANTLPNLYRTACAIHCHHAVYATKRDELFANFSASHRGAIRKPHPHPAMGGGPDETQRLR